MKEKSQNLYLLVLYGILFMAAIKVLSEYSGCLIERFSTDSFSLKDVSLVYALALFPCIRLIINIRFLEVVSVILSLIDWAIVVLLFRFSETSAYWSPVVFLFINALFVRFLTTDGYWRYEEYTANYVGSVLIGYFLLALGIGGLSFFY